MANFCPFFKVCEETQLVGVQRHLAGVQRVAVPQPAIAVAQPAVAIAAGHAAALPKIAPVAAHHLHKREAEPEADADADADAQHYGLAYPSGVIGARLGVAPVAAAPRCQAKVDRVCKKVPVQTQRIVQTPRCSSVPKTECADFVRDVTETACADVPREECHKVARKVPFEVPREVCRSIPRKHCRQVPHKTPRKVCKQVESHGYGYGHHH